MERSLKARGLEEGSVKNAVAESPLVGVGLYTIPDAARYIREPARRLSRWADGYTFQQDGETRRSRPVLGARTAELVDLRVLTFLDMVELKLVGVLRALGFSLPRIRAAAEFAVRGWETRHPFASRQIVTDGPRLLHRWGLESGGAVAEVGRAQTAFEELARPFYVTLDFDEDSVPERYWPFGKETGIVLDPERSFGQPIDEKSGVPTRVLYEMTRGGSSEEATAWWYEVDVAAVRRAVAFENALRT
jgi:uncharacterized protein (DUF433 family)